MVCLCCFLPLHEEVIFFIDTLSQIIGVQLGSQSSVVAAIKNRCTGTLAAAQSNPRLFLLGTWSQLSRLCRRRRQRGAGGFSGSSVA